MQVQPKGSHRRTILSLARRTISHFSSLNQESCYHQREQHHGRDIDAVPITNEAYWTNKVRALCLRRRDVDGALELVTDLRLRGYRPNALNLSNIVHALCDSGRFSEAFDRFLSFVSTGIVPDERTCNVVIARFLDSGDPDGVLDVLRRLGSVKPEYVCSLSNYNRLIHQLCKKKRFSEARNLLSEARNRGHCLDCVSWTALISGYSEFGDVENAQNVLDEMCQSGVAPNSLTYAALAGGFLQKKGIERRREFISKTWEMMVREVDANVNSAAFACIIDSLCKGGLLNEVFVIAMDMPQGKGVPEVYAYGQMIDSFCKHGKHRAASRIVHIMRKKGLFPSLVSYNSIVHGLARTGSCMRAYQLLKEGVEFGYSLSEYTFKVLVEALCEASDIGKARSVLETMLKKDGVDRTRIYNIYLRALHSINNPTELLNLLVSMLQSGCHPDVVSLNTVIHGFCKVGKIEESVKILIDMENGHFCDPNAVTYTTVICGLLDAGRTQEALGLFHNAFKKKNLKPHVVTYNGILQCLFKRGAVKEAEEIYNSMLSEGIRADCTTYSILISGLCDSGEVDKAKRLWDDTIRPSKTHDDHVYVALLKGLCMSGDFNGARWLLSDMVGSGLSPNVFSYNVLIDKACELGLKRDAYCVVGEMKKNGLAPDAVTWRTLHKLHSNGRRRLSSEKSGPSSGKSMEEMKTRSLYKVYSGL